MQPKLTLAERLMLIFEWYRGMVSERTGRLAYAYDPERELVTADGNAIRDIASVWDVELLSEFLGRSDLNELTGRSIRHYLGWLTAREGLVILDPERLAEPPSIAHSAFMLLSLLHSRLPERTRHIVALANSVLRRQRSDGSYQIHFGGEPDHGLEFYPGEAMLALLETYRETRDEEYLASVERAFAHYRFRLDASVVDSTLLVFCANWQSQAGALLYECTRSQSLRGQVGDYVFSLHDRIIGEDFYAAIETHAPWCSTVEVACALEGVSDAYAIAMRARDERRAERYARCIGAAFAFLFRAQRLSDCTPRERGGFGHSLTDRTQRIDVTGHVAGGFIKVARNGRLAVAATMAPDPA